MRFLQCKDLRWAGKAESAKAKSKLGCATRIHGEAQGNAMIGQAVDVEAEGCRWRRCPVSANFARIIGLNNKPYWLQKPSIHSLLGARDPASQIHLVFTVHASSDVTRLLQHQNFRVHSLNAGVWENTTPFAMQSLNGSTRALY